VVKNHILEFFVEEIMDSVRFSQKPYNVVYMKDGVKHVIKRRPPPVMHEMLPTDIVELTQSKNADWTEGSEYTVKNINPRHPNIIQIEDKEGNSTFVPYYDLNLNEMVAPRKGYAPKDMPANNKYLLWP
jgi:hypothetical protein